MKLTIRKQLDYLSPTSFQQALECELEFYLMRMSGLQLVSLPQNEQMAVGCAFDAFVKSRISELLGKDVKLAKLLDTVDEQNLHLIPIGHQIFDLYEKYGCINVLLEEGIEDIELEYKQIIGGKEIPGTQTTLGGVKLFGKPDAEIKLHRPHDWKTTGWGSKSLKSPPPGYSECFHFGYRKGGHKSHLPMHMVNPKWSTQLIFYKWMRHGLAFDSFRGSIDLIIIPPDISSGIIVAQYRNEISSEEIKRIWEYVKKIWESFQEGVFQEPIPSLNLCEPYQNPKPCTCFCPVYKHSLGNELHRKIMGK